MSQRGQPQRRGRRRTRQRRRKSLLTGLMSFVGLVATLAGLGANIHANGREHSSRQASTVIKQLDELAGSLDPWINGAKDVFAAANDSFGATGEWRPGTEFRDEYQSVYHAGTQVQTLQRGMSDARLKALLDAMRRDIQRVCASTSFHSANEASKAMLRDWGKTQQRIKELRNSESKRLQLIG